MLAAALAARAVLGEGAGDWRIEHATVLVGDPARSRWLEDAVVVVRGGVIREIGPASPRGDRGEGPGREERIDATGLLLHAAFIDAGGSRGLERRSEPPSTGETVEDASEGPLVRMPEARRAGFRPRRLSWEAWRPKGTLLEDYRRHGFSLCHVVEDGAILAGRTSVLALGGRPLRSAVVASRACQRLRLRPFGGGYPVSLMGTIASLRQLFIDARRQERWEREWREEPRGLPRPPLDPALASLQPVLSGSMPLLGRADTTTEIRRVAKLARELGARLMIDGGRESWKLAGELAREGVAVVLVPDGERRPEVKEEEGSLPRRLQEDRLARWERTRRGPALLAAAGVRFAWGTGGSRGPDRIVAAARAAVERGLDTRAAVRALTLGAAELVGLASSFGSVEVGKASHLVLRTRGDAPGASCSSLLDPKSRVRFLLIDRERFEFELPREKPAKAKAKETATETRAESKTESEAESEREAETEREAKAVAEPACELESDRVPRVRTGGDVLIRSATLVPVTSEVLPRTDLRVVGGRIAEIGRDLAPRRAETVIDAEGCFVMPGIVDAHSHLAMQGGFNEGSDSVTAEVRVRDVVDPRSVQIWRALAGGVTTANILHGSANPIGGQNCVIRLRYRDDPDRLPFPGAMATIKFALGENPKRSNSSARSSRFPSSRPGVAAVIRRAFEAARRYREELDDDRAARARGERRVPFRRDLRLEALEGILEGRFRVHAHCYRSDEIQMALESSAREGWPLAVLQHALEAYKLAPEIAASGVAVSTFSDWWAYKLEAYDAIPQNAALCREAGVLVSIDSDDPELIRHLNHEAAKCVRYGGMSIDDALRAITIWPARQLGIEDRVGSLEVGKEADLAIFDAHPLSVYARCRYTLIAGEVFFERRRKLPPRAGYEPAMPVRRKDTARPPIADSRPGLYALRGGRVVTVSGPVIESGTVLLRGGRIAAVGARDEVEIPRGAVIVELEGRSVLPGFIDAGSRLGLSEIRSVRSSVDTRELGRVQPDLVAATAVHAQSELIPVARAGGVTSTFVYLDGPLVAGQASWIGTAGTSTRDLARRDRIALHVPLPRVARGASEEPEFVEVLEKWMARAKAWRQARDRARADGTAGPVPDTQLEALAPYALAERPIVFTADREPTIRLAVRIAERNGWKAVIRGGRNAWKVAALLAKHSVPVIVGPVLSLPLEEHDPYDAPYANAGRLWRAGVPIAFQSAHGALSKNLPHQAGTAVAWGLPRDAALEALTLGAARILGVDREVGSIEAGKRGDLIIVEGDPLEFTSRIVSVFVDGRPTDLRTRHTRLEETFRERTRRVGRRFRRL